MFVDSRRRGLELFLNRLARHPALSKTEALRLFLHGGQEFTDLRAGKDGPEMGDAAPAAAAPAPAAKAPAKKGFMDYLSDVGSAVTSSVQACVLRVRFARGAS
jgi:hypothetical protein